MLNWTVNYQTTGGVVLTTISLADLGVLPQIGSKANLLSSGVWRVWTVAGVTFDFDTTTITLLV